MRTEKTSLKEIKEVLNNGKIPQANGRFNFLKIVILLKLTYRIPADFFANLTS